MKTVWTREAVNSFNAILDYLLFVWTTKEAQHFIELTDRIIKQIEKNPVQFPVYESQPEYRKVVITKQTSLFYRQQKDVLVIAYFWNSFQNPEKLSVKLKP